MERPAAPGANGTAPTDTSHKTISPPAKITFTQAVEEVSTQYDGLASQIAVALPPHITAEKFKSVVITAVNLNPDLIRADRRSLFNACNRAAADGLLPDGREGALVIFNTKEKGTDGKDVWKKKCQWMPMVYGVIKKIRQSGQVSSVGARIVYEAETKSAGIGPDGKPIPPRFRYIIADGEERVEHEPMLWGDRGPMVLVYACAKFKDGTQEFEPLTRADVEKARSVSKSKDRGPWVDWYEEMAKKTAIRRLAKRLPLSADLMTFVARDDEPTEIERIRHARDQALIGTAAAQLGAPEHEFNGNGEHEEEDEAATDRAIETGEAILADEAAQDAEFSEQRDETRDVWLPQQVEKLRGLSTIQEIRTLDMAVKEALRNREELQGLWNAARLEREREVSALKTRARA